MKRFLIFCGYLDGNGGGGCEDLLDESFDDKKDAVRFIISKTLEPHHRDWFHLLDVLTGEWVDMGDRWEELL